MGVKGMIPNKYKAKLGKSGNVGLIYSMQEERLRYKNDKLAENGWPHDPRKVVFYSKSEWSSFAEHTKQRTFLLSERETELLDHQFSAHYHNMKKLGFTLDDFKKTYNRTMTLTKNSYFRSYLFRIQHALLYGNSDFKLRKVRL
jgi:hypothetical protein